MKNEVVGMYLLKSGQLLRYNYIFFMFKQGKLSDEARIFEQRAHSGQTEV